MKIKLYFLSLLFVVFAFTSCKKSDFRYQSDFEKSYNEWVKFKGTSGNSYRYQVSGVSWSGMGWQTVITVGEGKVVQRYFKLSFPVGWTGNIPDDDKVEWTENENQINSHEANSAAEAVTLEVIYEKARNNWLKKRENAKTYFEAKNKGLISFCGYVEDGCQDDCFNGISITSIEPL
ncbi:MAG: hypothetical protein ABI208_00110 [Ginsengibacter sp.]